MSKTQFHILKLIKIFLIGAFVLFGIMHSVAQTRLIKGKIMDEVGNPLAKAGIEIMGNKGSALSDENGNFSISVVKFPSTLKISFLGFETYYRRITSKDTSFIEIRLQRKSFEMNPIEVKSKSVKEQLCCPIEKQLFDYDIYDGYIWMLYRFKNKVELSILDSNLNSIFDLPLPLQEYSSEKDCYNKLFLVSTDSAYSCRFNSKHAVLRNIYSRQLFNFNSTMFKAASKEYLYLKYEFAANINYLFMDTCGSKIISFYGYRNATVEQYHFDYIGDIAGRKASLDKQEIFDMGDIWINQLAEIRDYHEQVLFYELIVKQPLFTRVRVLQDSVFIFNHDNDSIFVFNPDGRKARAMHLKYEEENVQLEEIIADCDNKSAFYKYQQGGLTSIKEIDLKTGRPLYSKRIESHIFPEKIKIHKDYIYYLYENMKDNRKYLYREKI